MFNFAGKRPATLGVHQGQLRPCGDKPNCVCSQQGGDYAKGGDAHHIVPFKFSGDAGDAMTRLVAVVLMQLNSKIVTQSKDYLHAEFTSGFMGFVDDVEFYLPAGTSEIHVRSASRLGYSDFGVNRARVEELREAFDDAD